MRCASLLATAVAVGTVGAAWLAACHDATADDTNGGDAAALEARGDGAAAECVHATLPPHPGLTNGGAEISFVVAVRTIGIPDGGAPVGFDLDGLCTCNPDPSSCVSNAPCDGVGGRDTQGDRFLDVIDQYLMGTTQGQLNNGIRNGKLGYLFEVRGYNGLANDDQVTLVTYQSGGIVVDSFGDRAAPSWNGDDVWSVDPKSAIPQAQDGGVFTYTQLFGTVGAYVTDHQLVARLDAYPFSGGTGIGQLLMMDFRLVATIRPDPNGYALDGQLGGRTPTHEIFALLSTLADPAMKGATLCGNSPSFPNLRTQICQSADITSDKTHDSTGAPCDALGVGLAFTAFPAKLGAPFAVNYPPLGCDGAVSDCTD